MAPPGGRLRMQLLGGVEPGRGCCHAATPTWGHARHLLQVLFLIRASLRVKELVKTLKHNTIGFHQFGSRLFQGLEKWLMRTSPGKAPVCLSWPVTLTLHLRPLKGQSWDEPGNHRPATSVSVWGQMGSGGRRATGLARLAGSRREAAVLPVGVSLACQSYCAQW